MHLEWQCCHSKQPMAVRAQLSFYSWYSPYICIISLLTIEKSALFKGGCINWLGKSLFYSPTIAMWTPVLCIRNRPSFQKCGGRKWGYRGGKKPACIQTGGLAELMGTRRGAFFLQGNHLHNGKVVGVGAEKSPLVGTVGEVEGRALPSDQGPIPKVLREGRCTPPICSFLPPVTCQFHLRNNLPTISQTSAANMYSENLLLKKAAADFLRLHSANESRTIVSSQPAMIKKGADWFRNWNSAKFDSQTLHLRKLNQA